jgi:xylan 1,4-beta-xylosidase
VFDPTGTSVDTELASAFRLEPNYPNPFNPSTQITFQLDAAGMTSLRVYDVLGREVAVLVNEQRAAGEYTATFEAANLPSGTYLYVLEHNGQRQSSLMTLIK